MTDYTAQLVLRLRGQRNYVHSTELYPLVDSHASSASVPITSRFRLDLTRVIKNQLRLFISDREGAALPADAPAWFEYQSAGRPVVGYFLEFGDPVAERYTGSDNAIYATLERTGDVLSIADETGAFETIDMIAALAAKHELIEPASNGRKWLIARIEFGIRLPNKKVQRVHSRIERRLGANSIRSKLFIDEHEIGRVILIQGLA